MTCQWLCWATTSKSECSFMTDFLICDRLLQTVIFIWSSRPVLLYIMCINRPFILRWNLSMFDCQWNRPVTIKTKEGINQWLKTPKHNEDFDYFCKVREWPTSFHLKLLNIILNVFVTVCIEGVWRWCRRVLVAINTACTSSNDTFVLDLFSG